MSSNDPPPLVISNIPKNWFNSLIEAFKSDDLPSFKELVKFLPSLEIQLGVPIRNYHEDLMLTPLVQCFKYKSSKIRDYLLDEIGVNFTLVHNQLQPIHFAAQNGDLESVAKLLSKGVDLEQVCGFGRTGKNNFLHVQKTHKIILFKNFKNFLITQLSSTLLKVTK